MGTFLDYFGLFLEIGAPLAFLMIKLFLMWELLGIAILVHNRLRWLWEGKR